MSPLCRVVLIGMMGSGKSTVGRLLAQRTGWAFLDNDELMQRLFGATPRQVLAAGDESSLLAAEVRALEAGLAEPPPAIVAAAGGTIVDASARTMLAGAGVVVWVQVTEKTVMERSEGGEHRPWPEADRRAWIRRAIGEREALYRSVADLVLPADDASPASVADEIHAFAAQDAACRDLLTSSMKADARAGSTGFQV
jgi:shikimate kinase